MKFTLSWLKEHLDTDASLPDIDKTLTSIGLEVEGIEDKSADFKNFVVGHVVSCEQHPDADRLRVCVVDTGAEQVQVVCGAPNARQGMKGVFAPSGTHIPGTDLHLKKTKIRGVESNGMLCSERELGLSDDHDGIIDLPADTETGAAFAEIAGLNDPVIEIALTPDRADCAGVRGIARDLSATGIGTLKDWPYQETPSVFDSPIEWKRDLGGDGNACPMVVGRSFRGLKNGPSPKWLQDRLRAIGLRPISALVDITNYVTYDLGRPLHVYDADKIAGKALTMRFANDGEEILALDGKSYTLENGMTVIADDAGVQAIGGIIGGEATGCQEETTNVFLEVALFDPVRTATTGRKLAIESDARYRFERGVDPQSAMWGAEVASSLILKLCGGEASGLSIAGDMPARQASISLDTNRIQTLGGLSVEPEKADGILKALGFETSRQDKIITAAPPSWRFDIEREACLVEEVLRIIGFDNIPAVPLDRTTALPEPSISPDQRRAAFARKVLASRGMMEAVTWSFTDEATSNLFGGSDAQIRLANPISSDLSDMRPSILPNLIQAAGRNADRGFDNVSLFEVGPDYHSDKPDGQRLIAAGVRRGERGERHWAEAARPWDIYDIKADIMAVLSACGAPANNLQATADAPNWYHPGRSGVLRLGPKALANFGDIHPRILNALDVSGPVIAFEIMMDAIPTPRAKAGKARPLLNASQFQAVQRDFAFVSDDATPVAALINAIRSADRKLIVGVNVFDIYTGENVGAGKKSVALSVTFQPEQATMTDSEIAAISNKIIANVEKQTGASLRG